MSTLNMKETEALRDAMAVLASTQTALLQLSKDEPEHYDVVTAAMRQKGVTPDVLKRAQNAVNTVVSMKGYYPK